MSDQLRDRKIAILATDGVEQVEYEEPRKAVEAAGATATLVSIKDDEIQAMHGDLDQGDRFPVEAAVVNLAAEDFDALILPGGTINPTASGPIRTRSTSSARSPRPASRSARSVTGRGPWSRPAC